MDYRINAMIGGAEKAGTTSLGYYLGEHPAIVSPFGSPNRTPGGEFPGFVNERYDDPRVLAELIRDELPRPPSDGDIVMAKSVDLLHVPAAAERLHRHNASCRLIFSLRNPVDRAYSSYWYQRYRGAEIADTFETAIELERAREAEGIWSPHRMYLGKGRYAEHLQHIADLFERSQMWVLLFDDLRDRPEAILRDLYDFLDVEYVAPAPEQLIRRNPGRVSRWPRLSGFVYRESALKTVLATILPLRIRVALVHGIRRLSSAAQRPPPMDATTRGELIEYFAPHNRRLEDFLGRDLSGWNE